MDLSGRLDSNSTFTLTLDRKSTRLNSSHTVISYAVFCLKKKKRADARHNPDLTYARSYHLDCDRSPQQSKDAQLSPWLCLLHLLRCALRPDCIFCRGNF